MPVSAKDAGSPKETSAWIYQSPGIDSCAVRTQRVNLLFIIVPWRLAAQCFGDYCSLLLWMSFRMKLILHQLHMLLSTALWRSLQMFSMIFWHDHGWMCVWIFLKFTHLPWPIMAAIVNVLLGEKQAGSRSGCYRKSDACASSADQQKCCKWHTLLPPCHLSPCCFKGKLTTQFVQNDPKVTIASVHHLHLLSPLRSKGLANTFQTNANLWIVTPSTGFSHSAQAFSTSNTAEQLALNPPEKSAVSVEKVMSFSLFLAECLK